MNVWRGSRTTLRGIILVGGTSFILELRARAMRKFRDGGYNTGLLEGFPKEGGGGDEIYRTIFLDREGTDSAAWIFNRFSSFRPWRREGRGRAIQGAGSQTRSALKLLPTFEGATAAATRYTIPLLLRSSAHYYILYLSKLRWLPRSAIYHNDSGRRRRRRSLQNGRREAFLIPSPFRRRWGIKYSRSRKTIPFRPPPPKRATIQTFFLPLHLYPSRSPDTSNIFAIFRNRAEDKTWLGKNNILASPYPLPPQFLCTRDPIWYFWPRNWRWIEKFFPSFVSPRFRLRYQREKPASKKIIRSFFFSPLFGIPREQRCVVFSRYKKGREGRESGLVEERRRGGIVFEGRRAELETTHRLSDDDDDDDALIKIIN